MPRPRRVTRDVLRDSLNLIRRSGDSVVRSRRRVFLSERRFSESLTRLLRLEQVRGEPGEAK